MSAGRPPDGLQHINRLEGPREQKKRLRWIYASMMNQCTVEEACEAVVGDGSGCWEAAADKIQRREHTCRIDRPFAPLRKLRSLLQFDDWEMPAPGHVADMQLQLNAASPLNAGPRCCAG